MAWEARSGLKLARDSRSDKGGYRLNGLGSPFGIETNSLQSGHTKIGGLNGLGSPFGIETKNVDLL